MVKEITISGKTNDSVIMVGEQLGNLSRYVPDSQVVVITDRNVGQLYGKDLPSENIITLETGEGIKTLDTVKAIYARLMDMKIDRSGFVVGAGGGIVCDITGFAASTYMRGLPFGFVATTLLSQVDASVGGKNGVNHQGFKNMVGVFSQPEFVICDLNLLATLPAREILCGLAEIVKHGLIADADYFAYVEQNAVSALNFDQAVLQKLVYDSVVIKAAVVNQDEREQGVRAKLNFGHTFGHAIEKAGGFSHGESVCLGMCLAARISEKMGLLEHTDLLRIEALLRNMGFSVALNTGGTAAAKVDKHQLIRLVEQDKKKSGDYIRFILLEGIGRARIERLTFTDLATLL